MDGLMEFLNLPGVLPAIVSLIIAFGTIMTAIGLWIRGDSRRRQDVSDALNKSILQESEAKYQRQINDLKIAMSEARRKADEAKAELQESQTIASALDRLIGLQITNQEHNRKEREEVQRRNLESQSEQLEMFSRSIGQIAGTMATNTDTITEVVTEVKALVVETVTNRTQAAEVIKATVNAGVATIGKDLAAIAHDVQDLKQSGSKEMLPQLERIEGLLRALHERIPEISPLTPDTNGEPPPQMSEKPAA